jgi:hypothetical protein
MKDVDVPTAWAEHFGGHEQVQQRPREMFRQA